MGVGSLAQTYVTSRKQSGELRVELRDSQPDGAPAVRGPGSGRDQPITAVQRGDVEQWLDALDVSPRTKRIYLSCVRTFLAWCVAQEHLTRNPADGVAGPAALPPVPRALPALDITVVLTVLHSDRPRSPDCSAHGARSDEGR